MVKIPEHVNWLKDTGINITTSNGQPARLIEFQHDLTNATVITAWAKHFRENYCLDTEIDKLREGTGLSRAKYLKTYIFPNQAPPGPSVRTGDFAEILISDYFEFILNYIVPRTHHHKDFPNESKKGSDIIAFKLASTETWSSDDILICIEVKSQFSGKKAKPCLQNAVNDSGKDQLRKSYSLNAIKRRLSNMGDTNTVTLYSDFKSSQTNLIKITMWLQHSTVIQIMMRLLLKLQ